jgi:hypothetical protein
VGSRPVGGTKDYPNQDGRASMPRASRSRAPVPHVRQSPRDAYLEALARRNALLQNLRAILVAGPTSEHMGLPGKKVKLLSERNQDDDLLPDLETFDLSAQDRRRLQLLPTPVRLPASAPGRKELQRQVLRLFTAMEGADTELRRLRPAALREVDPGGGEERASSGAGGERPKRAAARSRSAVRGASRDAVATDRPDKAALEDAMAEVMLRSAQKLALVDNLRWAASVVGLSNRPGPGRMPIQEFLDKASAPVDPLRSRLQPLVGAVSKQLDLFDPDLRPARSHQEQEDLYRRAANLLLRLHQVDRQLNTAIARVHELQGSG